jgi:hypothetical protein
LNDKGTEPDGIVSANHCHPMDQMEQIEKKVNYSPAIDPLLQAIVTPAAQVMIKVIDAEIIALNLDSGHCYKFDPIASTIWQMIERKPSVADILGELTDSYDAPAAEIQTDLEEILDFMEKEQLVKIIR